MSVVISKSTNRLSKLLKTPQGGVTVARALKDADNNLEAIRPACLKAIDGALEEMAAVFDAGASLEDAQILYGQSNLIVGFAGSMGMAELSQAAYSLCDTLDRMITSKRWSAEAVKVHLVSMSRLRQVDGNEDICREIINGLRQVAGKFTLE
jgi:hypothetical protein